MSKTCTKCQRRLPDSDFRTRTVTSSSPDIEGVTTQESHVVSGGSTCNDCDSRRLRASRGTQSVHDVAQDILVDIR